MLIAEMINYLERHYPKSLAYDKDPIGLQLGKQSRELTKALVTLDVTVDVVDEAIEKGANFIVAHHPFIYRPLKAIDTETVKGRIVEKCLQNNIAIYAMHTNYDIAENGMNDVLAKALGLKNLRPLSITKEEAYVKLAVFVPATHEEAVRTALGTAGAGQMGNYSDCTFTSHGTGRFKPLAGSNPFLGELHELESVQEVKIEGIALQKDVGFILEEVRKAHPYEEPAFDIFHLQAPLNGKAYGLGRVGQASEPMAVPDFIQHVKKALHIDYARYSGRQSQEIQRVAIVGGSGSSFMKAAKQAGADLYITGDMGFHDAHDALELGLNVLDVGHYAESMMKRHIAALLQEAFGKESVLASKVDTDPFQLV